MPLRNIFSTSSWLYRSIILIIVLSALVVLYVSFLFVSPRKPISASDYQILNPVVNIGTKIGYSLIFCADKNIQFEDRRQLLASDFTLYPISSVIVHLDKGCTQRKFEALTPSNVPEGEYKILNTITLRLNSIQQTEVNFSSDVFKVKAK